VAEAGLALALVRPACLDDAPGIAAIWNPEVLHAWTTTDTEPRSLDGVRDWLARREVVHPVIVAVSDTDATDVLGYAGLGPYRPKPAFRGAAEDSVYVRRDVRGQRIGDLLLAHLIEHARALGHHTVLARIVNDNIASIRLHERHGFERIGVERQTAFKLGRHLDVALLQTLL
jgi:phosphinothricin acetyltransferase